MVFEFLTTEPSKSCQARMTTIGAHLNTAESWTAENGLILTRNLTDFFECIAQILPVFIYFTLPNKILLSLTIAMSTNVTEFEFQQDSERL